ncbi:MAG: phosphate signaling complex protein PhoU [Actinobacteria bacterium]|nr:phosphate signaling complex protein PhoU [Actinomycetota bacterium]
MAGPLRAAYAAELDQLRLQVELMAVRVDENLERMRAVLDTGDEVLAGQAIAADDEIDAMSVSLTERCYDLLAREQPVAGDLRFIVSVLRVLGEFERIGDLALRVVKVAPELDVVQRNPSTYDVVLSMADTAIERYREAMRAWSGPSIDVAERMLDDPPPTRHLDERLTSELLALEGSGAAATAIRTLVVGRSLERIADHAGIIAARLLFLATGDSDRLAQEVR